MGDLWSELANYERRSITLRLNERETSALLALLVDVPIGHHLKDVAVQLADKLGSEYCEHLPKEML